LKASYNYIHVIPKESHYTSLFSTGVIVDLLVFWH